MKNTPINIALIVFLLAFSCHAQDKSAPGLEGRWDLTIDSNGKLLPSWLEIDHSGNHQFVGRFVCASGSARPVSIVNIKGEKFDFSIPPQWESGNGNLTVEGSIASDKMTGSIVFPDGKQYSFSGVRAPRLDQKGEPRWSAPVALFDGKTLGGWHASGENQWQAENGILKSEKPKSNLITDKKFADFKLHIEFKYPKNSNSGVYLRGRYETQISDSKGKNPWVGEFGAIYGFITPSEMVAKDAGEWQSYDITLVGRMVTVVCNGVTIICNQSIPGITGGALDSNEGEPGPLMLQGDHGAIEFRNITIATPL